MQTADLERWDRVRAELAKENVGALVCRLPEHMVMLGGYWPVLGRSLVVFPLDSEPVVLAPVCEASEAERGWISDIRSFRAWRLGDEDPEVSLVKLLGQVCAERGLGGKRIGYEGSFGDVSPTQRFMEPWVGVNSVVGSYAAATGAQWVDFGPQLVALRGRKTEREAGRIRTANEIADFGVDAFFRAAVPGRRETEIAAEVESAVHVQGVGYSGVRQARAEAQVVAGARTVDTWAYPTSSDRIVEDGDLVVIEVAVVADGYWADLTRTAVAGVPKESQLRLLSAQRAAYEAALAAMKPGVRAAEVDSAARAALKEFGLAEHFWHHTGHGIGFRYHEPIPFVHPDSQDVLQVGMITSLEPALYSPEFGGIRVEDNVLITDGGGERLSRSIRWPGLTE